MASKNQQYVNLIGGQTLNVLDILNNQQDKTLERLNIVVDTTNGFPTDILLPEISQLNGFTNFEVTVSDNTGNSAAANITITRSGTDKINNTTSKKINVNFGKAFFQISSTTTWSGFDTYSSSPFVPPTQTNEAGLLDVALALTLLHTPLLTQHIIVIDAAGRAYFPTTGFVVNTIAKTITVPTLAFGDSICVYYSY